MTEKSSALALQQTRLRLAELVAENNKLKAENEKLKEVVLQFRKLEARDYMTCGKCGKQYHTLNVFDCPWCEQGLKGEP